MTAEACGECHAAELEVWKKTTHATGFKTLHRKAAAAAIAERLGLKLIKRDSPCLACHYTPTVRSGELRAASGVSCESCHGAGRDWINVHNDYGGKGFTHANETPEHRARRIAQSREAGMRRPSDLYAVVTSCFSCHTVPDERLVNVGGHSLGSSNFELVEWSQGEIRHNFLAASRGGAADNAERGPVRKRLMYVVGRAVDLEYGLRGMAEASAEGVYVKAMQRRVRVALSEVRAIAARARLPEVDAMVATVRGVKVGLGNAAALRRAADEVGAATRRFLENYDGVRLASLDPLVQGIAEDFEDDEGEEPVAVAESAPDEVPAASPSGSAPSSAAEPAASAGGSRSSVARASGAIPAVGEFKRKIRPTSRFKTLGPGACSRCHAPQNQWWFGDAHYRSADPFFDESPNKVRIARLYGLKPSQMTRGDHVCMDCHGSVISGREKRAVQDGVGCESCHGPAAEYKEPHEAGDKALGVQRPGYVKALELGMTELRDLEVRARTCTGCHYVTEPRLISAGHPAGTDFDWVEAMKKVKHWQRDDPPDALRAAFAGALAERGPVPKVQLARLGGPEVSPGGDVAAASAERRATPAELEKSFRPRPQGTAAATGASRSGVPRSGAPRSGVPRSGVPAAEIPVVDEPPARDLELPPFPEIDASASVEDVLRLVKDRLELLYRKVYQEGDEP